MEVRVVKKEEYSFIDDFVYEIFRHTNYSNGVAEKALVREIREKHFYIPELDLVVEEEGGIIGHFILSKFPISNKFENEILMLSPVSVAINKQRQGIGKYMLQEGIKLATKMGYKGIIVEGDYQYYQHFGFRTSTEFSIYASMKNLPPSVENLMAMELCENGMANISGEVDYSIYNSLLHGQL
ncbi:GNAT family N-acetyltransferase [Priestia endophytica]|uniref:Predicted N-acetyltransferase YhbS n=1 Tax=Priestia endophytica DSM 13796 TaxID=1121089 RepID=A0A1I5ZM19_9BACI|nr:N-acetyltransferase [Priestia endophytica]KYG29717.1 GNAT family acetyltransferase [Priestia endophytica]MBG9812491.1 GNAT family acetyltransferase [Priestia endophytica]SFQ57420.1 Predicted N-acetyltransferase YhbS [Priestia endophytica DSM 13796]